MTCIASNTMRFGTIPAIDFTTVNEKRAMTIISVFAMFLKLKYCAKF